MILFVLSFSFRLLLRVYWEFGVMVLGSSSDICRGRGGYEFEVRFFVDIVLNM